MLQSAPREIPATQEKEDPPRRVDLPVHIQQALPPIRIEGHIYDANPSARMVIINGHVRREGQQLEGGLRLEGITETGHYPEQARYALPHGEYSSTRPPESNDGNYMPCF